jgi:glucan phosphoethanolaminetransferase (alkaline phosphatase superfamily)
MIQRIQSVYLLMAVLFNIGMAFLPVFSLSEPDLNLRVYAFTQSVTDVSGASVTKPAPWLILFSISLAIIATIVVIFMYKDRKKQIRLCYSLYILQALIIVLALVWITTNLQISLTEVIDKAHPLSLIFPVVSMWWIFMAQRAIKKDEELVRSVDRIR